MKSTEKSFRFLSPDCQALELLGSFSHLPPLPLQPPNPFLVPFCPHLEQLEVLTKDNQSISTILDKINEGAARNKYEAEIIKSY